MKFSSKIKMFSIAAFAIILALAFSVDVEAKGSSRSGGSFGSSRSSSSRSFSSSKSGGSWGSSKKSSTAAKKAAPQTPAQKAAARAKRQEQAKRDLAAKKQKDAAVAQKKAAVAKAKATKAQTKSDAKGYKKAKNSPAYKKADAELSKSVGKSGKTFKTREAAEKSLRQKSYNKTYAAGSARPTYIPSTYQGHTTVLVGGYWGYYNPLYPTVFVRTPMDAYVFSQHHLYAWGYHPRPPVYYRGSTWAGVVGLIIVLCFIGWFVNRIES
jgi:hypothetical protein